MRFSSGSKLSYYIELRQQGGETEHLAPQDMQGVIDGVQTVHHLGDEQLCAVQLWECSDRVSGVTTVLFPLDPSMPAAVIVLFSMYKPPKSEMVSTGARRCPLPIQLAV